MLGLESRVKHHLLDVLEERAGSTTRSSPTSTANISSLLAAAQTREKDDVETGEDAGADRRAARALRLRADRLSGRASKSDFSNAVAGADEAIVVCTPEVSAVRDVDRVVGLLGNRFRPQLIVNRLRPALVRKGKMLSVDDVNAILRLPLLGRHRRRARR